MVPGLKSMKQIRLLVYNNFCVFDLLLLWSPLFFPITAGSGDWERVVITLPVKLSLVNILYMYICMFGYKK